jgi:hypothetical protein
MTPSAAGDGAQAGSSLPAAGVLAELMNALASARVGLAGLVTLVSMEARRAGVALGWMAVCGLAAALCLAVAWLGFSAALALCAVSLGLSPVLAVIAVAVFNLAAGAALIYFCIGLSRSLLFPATRRQLAGQLPVKPSAP